MSPNGYDDTAGHAAVTQGFIALIEGYYRRHDVDHLDTPFVDMMVRLTDAAGIPVDVSRVVTMTERMIQEHQNRPVKTAWLWEQFERRER